MRSLVLLPVFAALLSATAVAQIPHTISYQGRAEISPGNPVTGQRNVHIQLYDAPTGGLRVFNDAPQPVQFTTGGVFAMAIGANAPGGIPSEIFDRPLWVGITIEGVNGGNEFTPRYALHASPYGFRAIHADSTLVAAIADSARSIPWQIGEGDRSRNSTLDITDSAAGGKSYSAALHVTGRPYAIISNGVDSVNGYVVVARPAAGSTPTPGGLYRDNVPVAWGTVIVNQSTGTLDIISSFGVDSVRYGDVQGPSGGLGFRVYMQRAMRPTTIGGTTYPQMSVTASTLVTGAQEAFRVPSWTGAFNGATGIDLSSFYIILRDSAGRDVSGSFSFQVFGQLQ